MSIDEQEEQAAHDDYDNYHSTIIMRMAHS
jgi:hypothetical protein